MVDHYIKGSTGIIRAPSGGGGGGGGSLLVGVHAQTLIGFTDQNIAAGAGYVGIFHDGLSYFDGCSFDGTNVTPGTGNQGHWQYQANGKIVGTPGSGELRVVIAGLTWDGAYAGELARQVFTAADFAPYGYIGYGLWAKAYLGLSDNMGVYIVNDLDSDVTIEQGDPNDGTGPPCCQVFASLLTFAGSPDLVSS